VHTVSSFSTLIRYMLKGELEPLDSTPMDFLLSADRVKVELYIACTVLNNVLGGMDGSSCVDCAQEELDQRRANPVLISFVATILCCRAGMVFAPASHGWEDSEHSDITSTAIAMHWSVIELCVLHAEYITSTAALLNSRNPTFGDTTMSLIGLMDVDLYTHLYSVLEMHDSINCQRDSLSFYIHTFAGDSYGSGSLDVNDKDKLIDDIIKVVCMELSTE
jgi:hypothetical protein